MEYKIKDLGSVLTGNTPSKKIDSFWNSNDIGFVKPDLFTDNSITTIFETDEYISDEAKNKARLVDEGDIFVTCIASVGKLGIAGKQLAFNQQINAIKPNEKINGKYLSYALLANKAKMKSIANSAVVPIINKGQFEEFTLDINENVNNQIKTVKVLDKINEIIDLKKDELNKLDELVKSRFIELCSIENNENLLGSYISSYKAEKCNDRDFPVLSITKDFGIVLQDEKFKKRIASIDSSTYKVVPRGKFVQGIHIDEKNFAIQNIVDYGIVSPAYKVWNVNTFKVIPEVLAYAMRTDRIMHYIKSKAVGSVNRRESLTNEQFMNIPINLPSYEIQKEFVEFVEKVDKSKFAIQQSLDKYHQLFESLMQEYFG